MNNRNHMKVQQFVTFVKRIEDKHAKCKKYYKFRDHCHHTGEYRGAAHSICNLKYSVPKEVLIVFHKGSNYDYHFIKK